MIPRSIAADHDTIWIHVSGSEKKSHNLVVGPTLARHDERRKTSELGLVDVRLFVCQQLFDFLHVTIRCCKAQRSAAIVLRESVGINVRMLKQQIHGK